MPNLPSGTVTFLFSNIEGSTALWERERTAMAAAVDRHASLLAPPHVSRSGSQLGTSLKLAWPALENDS